MASLPFVGPMWKHRRPLTGERLVIVAATLAFLVFLLWASIAQVDEVTTGDGKVIPSSKLQTINAADAATVSEILVRSGQRVRRGQLLVRLDSPENESQLGQIEAETQSLKARSSRLSEEGLGTSAGCAGGDCAGELALSQARRSALSSKVAGMRASAEQARRSAGRPRRPLRAFSAALCWRRIRSACWSRWRPRTSFRRPTS